MGTIGIYQEKFFLSAGEVNAEGELALPVLTAKIIDIATAHANSLGIGNSDMADINTGWVLSRLTIEMNRYPKVNDIYIISTWITVWNRHFSERCFAVTDEKGVVLGYARSVWMVMNTDTHENAGLSHLNLPDGAVSQKECPILRQKKHMHIVSAYSAEYPGRTLIASVPDTFYVFKYCDLDYYRHVNTVRYVTLLLNQIPLEIHDSARVDRMELSFLHEASYGMKVMVRRAETSPGENSFLLFNAEKQESIMFARFRLSSR